MAISGARPVLLELSHFILLAISLLYVFTNLMVLIRMITATFVIRFGPPINPELFLSKSVTELTVHIEDQVRKLLIEARDW